MNNLNIDYALLATQKLALLNDPFCQTDAGQGILCLIDALQDEAVKNGKPENIVFPHRSEQYRLLKIIQDEQTGLYTIEGILDKDMLVVITHVVVEDIDGDSLHFYVDDEIADRVRLQGFETFDDSPMTVKIPL